MSSIGQPGQAPGRLPKQVYWRRRAVVLFALVAVIVVVMLIVVRPGSGAQGESPVAAGAPTSTADPATTTDAAGSADPAAAPGSVDAATTDPNAPAPACAAGNISVTPVTDASSYAAGVNPQISFTIENTGSEPCTINAGTSQQLYTITSGDETYWVSTDCQTGASDTQALLEPGVVVSSTPFAWDRTRSSAGTCDSTDRPQVPAAGASYHLTVQIAGIPAADTQQFILN